MRLFYFSRQKGGENMAWMRRLFLVGVSLWFLLASSAIAGEVHVYTDREIRTALLELLNGAQQSIDDESYCSFDCLRQSLPYIAEAITAFTKESCQTNSRLAHP